jgi:hypothetical protein
MALLDNPDRPGEEAEFQGAFKKIPSRRSSGVNSGLTRSETVVIPNIL